MKDQGSRPVCAAEGWFRLAPRGKDPLGIESQECSWATPKVTWPVAAAGAAK